MERAEQTLLSIIKSALFQSVPEFPWDKTDFEALYEEAKVQCVQPLVYDFLGKSGVKITPPELNAKWWQEVGRLLLRNKQLRTAQKEAIALLEQAGIPCVVLKGTSAAAAYPDAALRVLGDIDILVEPERQLDAVAVLQDAGYGEVRDEEHHCHLTIAKKGISVEVHREPNGLFMCSDEKVCQSIRCFLADAVACRQWNGEDPVLSDDHQAVVLLLHKLEHFVGGGLGLRQLCDWAAFVDKRMTAGLWHELEPKLDGFGLKMFAQVITRVCVDYLGLPCEKALWAMSADENLAAMVMENILQAGNFGRKESAKNYGGALFTSLQADSAGESFFQSLKKACQRNWKPCKKHPALIPLALPKVLIRHIHLRSTGQRAAFHPTKTLKQAKARRELVDSLKPFSSK